MPLYKINAPMPGSYVEGLGVLRTGEVVNVPASVIVRRNGRDRRVAVAPRLAWIPQDDEAWKAFHNHFGNVKVKERDAAGNVIKDQLGNDVETEFKDKNGNPVQIMPLPDLSPEPEMTPEEEEAAIEAKKRAEELNAARLQAVEDYKAMIAGQNQFPPTPLPVPTPAEDPILKEQEEARAKRGPQRSVTASAAGATRQAGATQPATPTSPQPSNEKSSGGEPPPPPRASDQQ